LNIWSKNKSSPMRSILGVQVRPESAFKLIRIRTRCNRKDFSPIAPTLNLPVNELDDDANGNIAPILWLKTSAKGCAAAMKPAII
jgi:hypothetical protein